MLPGLPRAYQHTLCRAWLCRAMHVRVVGEAPVGQPESAAAHWLPGASPRVTHSAPMAWALRARAPVAAGSLPRATRSAPKAGALRARAPTCAPRVTAHVVSWGSGDVEEVVCCVLLERLGARRASSSCRGRGWGGTPRGPCCHRLRHARAERRYGGSWQEGGARAASPPLQGLAPPARRPRAAGTPWEARARAARVQTAGRKPLVVVVVVVRTPTPNYLRQASPDRGKYVLIAVFNTVSS